MTEIRVQRQHAYAVIEGAGAKVTRQSSYLAAIISSEAQVSQINKQALFQPGSDVEISQAFKQVLYQLRPPRPFKLSGVTTMFGNLDTVLIPPLWNPSQLSPSGWYEADDPDNFELDGTGVEVWKDLSSNENDMVQNTGANRPNYSSVDGWVDFGAQEDDYFLVPAVSALFDSGNSPFYAIAILNAPGTSANRGFYGQGVEANDQHPHLSTREGLFGNRLTIGVWGSGDLNTSSDAWLSDTDFIAGFSYSNPGRTIRVNGSTSVSDNYSSLNAGVNNPSMGKRLSNSSSSSRYHGKIKAFIAFNSDVEPEDRERLEGYLAHKYGLTEALAEGHPYKNSPPYA